MKKAGIYKIENLIDGKIYIGSSIALDRRLRYHVRGLENNMHFNRHLQRSWNKYGKENFRFEILEVCPKELLVQQEQYYIDHLKACEYGYNVAPMAGSVFGLKHTEATKQKLSEFFKGKVTWMKGKTHSKEIREKISLATKGRTSPVKGTHLSEETKQKLSVSHKGKALSEETKQKMSEAHKGKKLSEETKKKMSIAKKGQVPWCKGLKLINRRAP